MVSEEKMERVNAKTGDHTPLEKNSGLISQIKYGSSEASQAYKEIHERNYLNGKKRPKAYSGEHRNTFLKSTEILKVRHKVYFATTKKECRK